MVALLQHHLPDEGLPLLSSIVHHVDDGTVADLFLAHEKHHVPPREARLRGLLHGGIADGRCEFGDHPVAWEHQHGRHGRLHAPVGPDLRRIARVHGVQKRDPREFNGGAALVVGEGQDPLRVLADDRGGLVRPGDPDQGALVVSEELGELSDDLDGGRIHLVVLDSRNVPLVGTDLLGHSFQGHAPFLPQSFDQIPEIRHVDLLLKDAYPTIDSIRFTSSESLSGLGKKASAPLRRTSPGSISLPYADMVRIGA